MNDEEMEVLETLVEPTRLVVFPSLTCATSLSTIQRHFLMNQSLSCHQKPKR